jgi:hypothetical protein
VRVVSNSTPHSPSALLQIFCFFVGFLFQSIELIFWIFGLGTAVILVVCDLMFPNSIFTELLVCECEDDHPSVADVQPAPSHMATVEGDEGEGGMMVGRHAVAALCDVTFIIFSRRPDQSILPNIL